MVFTDSDRWKRVQDLSSHLFHTYCVPASWFCCIAICLCGLSGCNRGINDSNPERRLSAIETVNDQVVLAKLAITDSDRQVRKAAQAKLRDPASLAMVATSANDWQIRRAAAQDINDTRILTMLASEDKNWHVRMIALVGVSDQTILAHIALSDSQKYVRLAALGKLTDQNAIGRIAVSDSSKLLRKAAVEKLIDFSLVKLIAEKDRDEPVRIAAQAQVLLKSLDDPNQIEEIAIKHSVSQVRLAAINKLDDQNILCRIAQKTADGDTRSKAIEKFSDQMLVMQIDSLVGVSNDYQRAIEMEREKRMFARKDANAWKKILNDEDDLNSTATANALYWLNKSGTYHIDRHDAETPISQYSQGLRAAAERIGSAFSEPMIEDRFPNIQARFESDIFDTRAVGSPYGHLVHGRTANISLYDGQTTCVEMKWKPIFPASVRANTEFIDAMGDGVALFEEFLKNEQWAPADLEELEESQIIDLRLAAKKRLAAMKWVDECRSCPLGK